MEAVEEVAAGMPEAWRDEVRMAMERPETFQPGQHAISTGLHQRAEEFRIRLFVYPAGYNVEVPGKYLCIYVEMLPPLALRTSGHSWMCEDVHVEIGVVDEEGNVDEMCAGWFTFTDSAYRAGFHDVIFLEDLEDYLQEGHLHLHAVADRRPRCPGRREEVEVTLRRGDLAAEPGSFVRSRRAGLPNNFMFLLDVFPHGYPDQEEKFGVVLEMWPGRAQEWWESGSVRCQLSICSGAEESVLDTAYFTFDADDFRMGWSDLQAERLSRWRGGAYGDASVTFKASLEFPLSEDEWNDFVHDVDFTQMPTYITFHLAEKPPMYFDKRILISSSDYFEHMLGDAGWKEAQSNEVDLSSDPLVDHRVMTAIFHFMLSETFSCHGDVMFALSVRNLADRYGLTRLVERTESELEDLLSEDNVLSVLAHVFLSGGKLEHMCVELVKYNNCELLSRQKDKLFQMMTDHPVLAKKLVNLSLLCLGEASQRLEQTYHAPQQASNV